MPPDRHFDWEMLQPELDVSLAAEPILDYDFDFGYSTHSSSSFFEQPAAIDVTPPTTGNFSSSTSSDRDTSSRLVSQIPLLSPSTTPNTLSSKHVSLGLTRSEPASTELSGLAYLPIQPMAARVKCTKCAHSFASTAQLTYVCFSITGPTRWTDQ